VGAKSAVIRGVRARTIKQVGAKSAVIRRVRARTIKQLIEEVRAAVRMEGDAKVRAKIGTEEMA
jgi:hypothetical protein